MLQREGNIVMDMRAYACGDGVPAYVIMVAGEKVFTMIIDDPAPELIDHLFDFHRWHFDGAPGAIFMRAYEDLDEESADRHFVNMSHAYSFFSTAKYGI